MAHATTYTDAALADFLRLRRQRQQESNKKSIGAGTMRSIESGEMLAQFDAAIKRLELLARLSPLQQQFLDLVLCIDAATPAAPVKKEKPAPVMHMTGSQAEQITRLANHPLLSRPQKTQALLKINRLNEEEAALYIEEFTQQVQALETAATGPDLVPAPLDQHPAIQLTARDQAYNELTELLRHERVRDDERVKAGKVIGEMSEAQLREKITVVRKAIADREAKTQALAA